MTQPSILITGCSSGIGLDAARGLKARGWRVFATCRQEADCDRLRAEGLESLLEDLPRGALREIFETNLFGYHDLTRQVIPVMRRQGHGRIVNCSSVLGLVGATWRGAYVATKFAMEGLTDVLRIEMRGTGIDIVLIEPGPITTKIRENAIAHFEKWIDWENSARREQYSRLRGRLYGEKTKKDAFELGPEAVTAKLIRALEDRRPKARYYVTTPTYLMGALRRVLPTSALDWLIAKG